MEAGCAMFLFGIVAVVAMIVAARALSKANELTREIERLRAALETLSRRVTAEPKPQQAATAPPRQPAAAPPQPQYEPAFAPPAAEPTPASAAEPPPPKPVGPPPPPPREPAAPPRSTQHTALSTDTASQPPLSPKTPFDWESLVGVKLFSWIAGVALVLAAVFFLSYSVQHGWLRPAVRAVIGIITGCALIVVGELRYARRYKLTADALDGAGVAILYATLFALYALWHLLTAPWSFALMIVVTAVAVTLSVRRDSVFIALLGLLGGFATPALLSTGENKPIALFGYLLLLNIGLAWVAMTKRWPVLTAITVVLTAIYEWAWLARFLTAAQLPIAAAIFAVFSIAAGSALWIGRRGDDSQPQFDHAAVAGAALPLLFAIFAAAVPVYGARFHILFGFLLLITTALSIVALFREPRWLHLLGGVATVLVFIVWFSVSYTSAAWPVILGWIAAFVVTQLATTHFNATPKATVAPLLFLNFAILAVIEKGTASRTLFFGTLFVLMAIVAAYAWLHDAAVVYFTGAFLTIATEAIWTGEFLDASHLYAALVVYVAFGLLFVAAPIRNGAFLALSTHLFLIVAAAPLEIPLWPMFIALAVIDVAIGLRGDPRVTACAMFASQFVLLAWTTKIYLEHWSNAGVIATHVALLIALLVVIAVNEWHQVAVAAVAVVAVATLLAPARTPPEQFLACAPFYAIFIAYPLIVRSRQAIGPYVGAVFESGVFFFFAWQAMLEGGQRNIIGLLPLFEAAVMLALFRVRRHPLVAGAALAFITVAIPLQFEKEWITLGWALEAAALVWLFRRIPHRGLLAWSGGLFAAVFVRLVFNPAVFAYHPVSHTPIVNWYLYTYLAAAAAFFAGARLLPAEERRFLPPFVAGGTILIFAVVNIEIADFYSAAGRTITFDFFSSSLAQDLTYTMAWAIFALAMLVAGIILGSRGGRIAAIVLLLVTVLKCFLHDLARLGGLYRVGSLLGLAISLVLVGVLLQRFVMTRRVSA